MDIKRAMTYLYWLYYQYKLITCSELLVPCEKLILYTVVIPILAMIVYMVYIFITMQINLVFQIFLHVFGNQPVSIMT
uniref:Serine palmitoyltransferase small subunit B n=1 Tax=Pelusios castaneus TaxID=367368 RepID=A0A8C8RVG4_9SAUR